MPKSINKLKLGKFKKRNLKQGTRIQDEDEIVTLTIDDNKVKEILSKKGTIGPMGKIPSEGFVLDLGPDELVCMNIWGVEGCINLKITIEV